MEDIMKAINRFVIAVLILFLSIPGVSQESTSFTIISWNVQTFGGSVSQERQNAFSNILSELMKDNNCVLAAQEVANDAGNNTLLWLLPGGDPIWDFSFQNTSDSQDNGIWFNSNNVSMDNEGFVFSNRDSALHPIRWAHLNVDNFDFTIFSLHLTFASGDAQESKRELVALLNRLKSYFNDSLNDPDVIICGDFNIATNQGKLLSDRAGESDWITIDEILTEHGYFDEKFIDKIMILDFFLYLNGDRLLANDALKLLDLRFFRRTVLLALVDQLFLRACKELVAPLVILHLANAMNPTELGNSRLALDTL